MWIYLVFLKMRKHSRFIDAFRSAARAQKRIDDLRATSPSLGTYYIEQWWVE